MKSPFFNIFLIACLPVLMASCIKQVEYPPVPVVEFKDFIRYGNNDSCDLVFHFRDGDGDIGLDDNEIQPPYDSSNIYFSNVFFVYYYKNAEGKFVKYYNTSPPPSSKLDSFMLTGRIWKNLTPRGQNKTLEGDVYLKKYAPFYVKGHKTIRFELFMYDRALNKSNVVVTPEFTME